MPLRRYLIILSGGLLVLGLFFVLRMPPGVSTPSSPRESTSASSAAAVREKVQTPGREGLTQPPVPEVKAQELEKRYSGERLSSFREMSAGRQAREMAQVLKWERVVLDPQATPLARAQAFDKLARDGAFSPECVSSMATLLASNPTASSIRSSLCESLGSRSETPEVREALLTSLHADSNEMVRKRAAQGLRAVARDSRVRASLEQACHKETSEFVRHAIREVLTQTARPTSPAPSPK
jgi:hypothetical protein